MANTTDQAHKVHSKPHAGARYEKKKNKGLDEAAKQSQKGQNPKAFTFQSAGKTMKAQRRKQDISQKRLHVPQVDRTPLEPPPAIIAVVGPPKVGKSSLIRSLVKRYTKQNLKEIIGPITVVAGQKRRITFIECNNDLNSMIDVAKIADLVLLLIDASFGFEMETFEFLNILQCHGFPKVMGVLTHLDHFKDPAALKKVKKRLKHRFWTEIYQGAKLFYLNGLSNGKYLKQEILNLSRFIGVTKFRPLTWRNAHPYILGDRLEDLTDPEQLRTAPHLNRTVSVYGYLRGTTMRANGRIHIPGVGDHSVHAMNLLPDPCPLPEKSGAKRRTLNDKQRLIYAPMSDVGGVIYDKDAVYINVPGHYTKKSELIDAAKVKADDSEADASSSEEEAPEEEEATTEGQLMVRELQDANTTIGDMLKSSTLKLFSSSEPIKAEDYMKGVTAAVPEEHDGRTRRRATFATADPTNEELVEMASDDEGDEEEEEEEDAMDGVHESRRAMIQNAVKEAEKAETLAFAESDSDFALSGEEKEGEDEDNILINAESAGLQQWRSGITDRAAERFKANKKKNLAQMIYGEEEGENEPAEGLPKDAWTDEGFFKVQKKRSQQAVPDSAKLTEPLDEEEDEAWMDELKDRFITGGAPSASDPTKPQEEGEEDEVFGDFEDLETGEAFTGAPEEEEDREEEEVVAEAEEDEALAKTDLEERKAALKAKFDAEYDEEEDGKGLGDDTTFYDDMKEKMSKQEEINRAAFADLDEDARSQLQGFKSGAYVRVVLKNVPCEMVDHFDGRFPLLLGGLLPNEDNFGFVRVRIKKHRWRKKILKTNDPLIFSIGWRRFQSLPTYSIDDRIRNRLLKYTPEHMHCLATFYGPMTPPNTGFCAFQSLSNETAQFRVAATGTVLDIDKSAVVVKKLKLTGVPYKIYKNSAFIKNMFTTALEVSKFQNASIKTVSGIRGQVKKAESKPEGAFRATFEDKILLSDIVFLKAWYPVRPKKFYTTVTNLLMADKMAWQGMKLVGQLRIEHQQAIPHKSDSVYKPVERQPRHFNPLKVPRTLQAALPFSSKPKELKKRNKPTYETRRAVVMEPEEKRVHTMMQQLRTVQRDKDKKRQAAKKESFARLVARKQREEEKRAPAEKEKKKEYFMQKDKERKRQEASQHRLQSRADKPIKRRKVSKE